MTIEVKLQIPTCWNDINTQQFNSIIYILNNNSRSFLKRIEIMSILLNIDNIIIMNMDYKDFNFIEKITNFIHTENWD